MAFGVMSAEDSAIVTSSAYEVMTEAERGQSWRKKLKIVGDRTAPWGTPEWIMRLGAVAERYLHDAVRPRK